MRSHLLCCLAVLWAAAGLLGACDKPGESKPAAQRTDAAPKEERGPVVDPRLRAALSAAAPSPSARRPADASDGPPDKGVFEDGAADHRHAKGQPTKVNVGTDGSEPRSAFSPKGGDPKGTGRVTAAISMGPRDVLPTIDLMLAFSAEKPLPDGGGLVPLLARVQRGGLAANQPGRLPGGAAEALAKVTGSELQLLCDANGGAQEASTKLAKGALPELGEVLDRAAEALFVFAVPPPSKPVGVGASWLAESRHDFGGVDAISYRLYRVTRLENGIATLSVNVRQYAANAAVEVAGVPKGAKLVQFESRGDGELEIALSERLAQKGKLTSRRILLFEAPGAPAGAAMSLEVNSDVSFSR